MKDNLYGGNQSSPVAGGGWLLYPKYTDVSILPLGITTIKSDPNRLLIAIYGDSFALGTTFQPSILQAAGAFPVPSNNNYPLEWRYSTHGPMVQEEWTYNAVMASVGTIYEVTRRQVLPTVEPRRKDV